MSSDIQATKTQVQGYIANTDPATQQADMAAAAELLVPLEPAEIAEVTQATLRDLSIDDKGDLFKELAERLDEHQLMGVASGLADGEDPADLLDFANAVRLFSPEPVHEALAALRFAAGPGGGEPPPQEPATPDPALVAQQAFIGKNLPPGQRGDPQALYRLFMQNPQVMAQPLIHAHYRRVGGMPINAEGRIEIGNEVGRALGLPAQGSLPDNPRSQSASPLRDKDYFAASLGEEQLGLRDAIVEKIVDLGGENATFTSVPVVYAVDGKEGGLFTTVLFKVEGSDGQMHFVDDQVRDYDNVTEYRENNGLPAQDVKLAMPRDGTFSHDVGGNVKLFVGDARIESGFETFRRVTHADKVALGVGVIGAVVVTAGQVGWVAAGSLPVLMAEGGLLAGGLYGTASGVASLATRVKLGDNLNPIENPGVALDAANVLLGFAGTSQMLTQGLGRSVLRVAGRERQLAQAATDPLKAALHADRAATFAQWAQKPTAIGDRLFTYGVNKTLAAANTGQLGTGGYSLWDGWDQLDTRQKFEAGLSLGVNAIGLAAAVPALRRSQLQSDATPPPDAHAPAPVAPPRRAPLPESIIAKGQPVDIAFTDGTNPVDRQAVWFKPGEMPGSVALRYADLLRERGVKTDRTAGVLAEDLRTQHTVVVFEGSSDGAPRVVGAASVTPNWKGARTLQLGSLDTGIPVHRNVDGNRLKRGDALVSDVVGATPGDVDAVRATLTGASEFTGARRLLWNEGDPAAQGAYADALAKEFPGVKSSFTEVQRNAPHRIADIPVEQRTPEQRAVLGLPTAAAQRAAAATLDVLPPGAKVVGFEFPLGSSNQHRTVRLFDWVAKASDPVNNAINPVRWAVNGTDLLRRKLAEPSTLTTFAPTATTGERVATLHPPGTLQEGQRVDLANGMLAVQAGRMKNLASPGDLARQLDDLHVVRVTETTRDVSGQESTRLVGGVALQTRYAGPDGDGRWLGAELPPDAGYLSKLFGDPAGREQAVNAAQIAGARLRTPELGFFSRWPEDHALFSRQQAPVSAVEFTPEASRVLLNASPRTVSHLPNPVREAVLEARALPGGEQKPYLDRALKQIQRVDFQTTFSSSQKLYGSLLDAADPTVFSADAARTLLRADAAVVDMLPVPLRDATATAYALPPEQRQAALAQALSTLSPADVPPLHLPGDVLRLSYRQPVDLNPTFLQEWAGGAWQWAKETRPFSWGIDIGGGLAAHAGRLRGRPVEPTHLRNLYPPDTPQAAIDAGQAEVQRVATLYPPGTLSKAQIVEQADLALKANSELPNSPYARFSTAQVAEQLQKLYVVQVTDAKTGRLLGGAAVGPDWQGSKGDGHWLGAPLPKNVAYLSHVFGSQGAGEQATVAAADAASQQLHAPVMAFYTRWQGAQVLYHRLNVPVVDVRFTPEAPDLLLTAGPVTQARLPAQVRGAIDTAKAQATPAQQRAHLEAWMKGLDEAAVDGLITQVPSGVLRVSYADPYTPTLTRGQTVARAAGNALSGTKAALEWTAAEFNPYAGPRNIQPGPTRQALRDYGHVAKDWRDTALIAGGVPFVGAGVAQILTGSVKHHEDDPRATAPFNALAGSESHSWHFPWMSTTLSVWGSGPAVRGLYGIGDEPGLPYLRYGASPVDPSGPKSATVVVAARANLGEVGIGLQIGNNEQAFRATGTMRLLNGAFNLRADGALRASGWNASTLTSLTAIQPTVTTGLFYGPVGVVDRDLSLVLGPAAQLRRLSGGVASQSASVFWGGRGFVGGSVSQASGAVLTLNPGHGKPEPDWTPAQPAEARQVEAEAH